jgi:aldose 1-epimerase
MGSTTTRLIGGREQPVVTLAAGDAMAEVLPGLGCNCVRWTIAGRDRLYAPPPDELAARPTRGGIPILFPFPNRIRGGRFVWDGREYQLPLNDSSQRNAIHGFSPRAAWQVLGTGPDADGAWLDAAFALPNAWPAPGVLELRIRLTPTALRYEALVLALDQPLPFGLGLHPYFATTPDCRVRTPAHSRWELAEGLPTGRVLRLDAAHDLRESRPLDGLTLDDVYTVFPVRPPAADGLVERGRVEYPGAGVLRVRTSLDFRELVLFTPPHGRAVCLEPYTCPTDAIHLQEHEDVGWRVLPPGGRWEGVVEYVWETAQ